MRHGIGAQPPKTFDGCAHERLTLIDPDVVNIIVTGGASPHVRPADQAAGGEPELFTSQFFTDGRDVINLGAMNFASLLVLHCYLPFLRFVVCVVLSAFGL
jgi:hypothetical protein